MYIENLSVKIKEFAEPLAMNLQLFSDSVPTEPIETTEPIVETPIEGENVEVTEPQVEEPVETPIQDDKANRAFAELRRQAQQYEKELKSRDEWVSKTFGQHGINTWSEYQQAMEQQIKAQQEEELRQQGIDPQILNKYLESNPELQYARQVIEQQKQQENFNRQAQELFNAYPNLNPKDIPDEVLKMQQEKGLSLLDAYEKHEFQKFKSMDLEKLKKDAVQEYIKKVKQGNLPVEGGGSSPVIQSEPPKTFDEARKQALEFLKNNK